MQAATGTKQARSAGATSGADPAHPGGGAGKPYLQVVHARKQFGNFVALGDVSFSIDKGEFVCFLGPSGCGKTTLLRCIAGLEALSSGQIIQDDVDISRLPPTRRDFGIVFQSYALFPNPTVEQNIAFGLQSHGWSRERIRQRVAELTAIVGLAGQEPKYPAQLSGGQQQRVALARALAPSPGLLLLDEPLSALDAKVRVRLRREIKRVQRLLGITTIMVTHDQEEALSTADRIIVMRDGHIDQIGDSHSIYQAPATPFVADFIGTMNFIEGTVVQPERVQCAGTVLQVPQTRLPVGTPVICAFRPEHLTPQVAGQPLEGANLFEGTIIDAESLGASTRLYLRTGLGGNELKAVLHDSAAGLPGWSIDEKFPCHVLPEHILVFEKEGRAA